MLYAMGLQPTLGANHTPIPQTLSFQPYPQEPWMLMLIQVDGKLCKQRHPNNEWVADCDFATWASVSMWLVPFVTTVIAESFDIINL